MGEAVDRLVGLAGKPVRVEAHKRTSKSGKTVNVKAHMRAPSSMSNAELTDAFKHFPWGDQSSTYTQKTNQYNQIRSEFRKRGLMTFKKGGSSQDNDPNHPSWEAKPTLASAKAATKTKSSKTPDKMSAEELAVELKALGDKDVAKGLSASEKDRWLKIATEVRARDKAKSSDSAKPKQQTPASKAVSDIVEKSKGKRGARLADVAYALGVSNESAKRSIQHAIDSGILENRSKGNAMSLFPKMGGANAGPNAGNNWNGKGKPDSPLVAALKADKPKDRDLKVLSQDKSLTSKSNAQLIREAFTLSDSGENKERAAKVNAELTKRKDAGTLSQKDYEGVYAEQQQSKSTLKAGDKVSNPSFGNGTVVSASDKGLQIKLENGEELFANKFAMGNWKVGQKVQPGPHRGPASPPEKAKGEASHTEVMQVVNAYGNFRKAARSEAKDAQVKRDKTRARIKKLAADKGWTLDLLDATVTDNNGNIFNLMTGLKKK